ncbi:MAG: helix-turn-helix transcriptional regulator, partial [Specibacter sp.]
VAAKLAEDLHLPAVESRCAVMALDFAREAGDSRRARAAQDCLDRLVLSIPVLPLAPQSEGVKLTQRELQVAKLASRGLGNRAIAEKMGVSVRTVEGHLYQVFAKLGITSRNELMQVREVS